MSLSNPQSGMLWEIYAPKSPSSHFNKTFQIGPHHEYATAIYLDCSTHLQVLLGTAAEPVYFCHMR